MSLFSCSNNLDITDVPISAFNQRVHAVVAAVIDIGIDCMDGGTVGMLVGRGVGDSEGFLVGDRLGLTEGVRVGEDEGTFEGAEEGEEQRDGTL